MAEELPNPPEKTEADDGELVAAARCDPEAFARLYRRYLTPVYRYLYARVGNRADTEDLTSQVFLAAFERLPAYRHRGHFAAWLFAIARRKTADYYRQHRSQALLEQAGNLHSATDEPSAALVHAEDVQNLARSLSNLDEREQELIRLRFAAGLGFAEIALLLNRKESAVKMALYRLLERLERDLEVGDG